MTARADIAERATLLRLIGGVAGLPSALDHVDDDISATVISAHQAGPTWLETFPPGPVALDRLRAMMAVRALRELCRALTELHRLGASHRALEPAGVLLLDRASRAVPRDLGLAGITPAPGEGRPRRSADRHCGR